MVLPGPAGAFTDLVLHLLAHLPLEGPGNLQDARYEAWAAGVHGPQTRALLAEDAPLLGGLWSAAQDPHLIQAWPDLHASLEAFAHVAARDIDAVGAEDVQSPELLEAIKAADRTRIELTRASLGLLLPELAQAHTQHIAPRVAAGCESLAPHLERAAAVLPDLTHEVVQVSWPLGARGRALPTRILVGCPNDWGELDPRTPAVLALHEHAVRAAPETDYAAQEWTALVEVARSIHLGPTGLQDAHHRWLTGLNLAPLLEEVQTAGLVSAALTESLLDEPTRRAERLAAR